MFTADPTAAAIACALCYGTSTYLGGRSAAHIGPARAVSVFQATGFGLAVVLLFLAGWHEALFAAGRADIALALVSGLAFAVGWAFLSHGLARGRTTVVAPVETLVSVTLCAIAEGLIVGWPGPALTAGIALAIVSAGLIGGGAREQVPGGAPLSFSVLFGTIAGLCFGVSYLTLGFVSAGSGIVALVVMRFFAAAGALVWLGCVQSTAASHNGETMRALSDRQERKGLAFAVAGGVCDGFGTLFFILATVNALIGFSVAILSLYAAVTVLLGIALLRERPTQVQIAGLTTAVAAVIVLTI
jgi:drug/metabolite transporter (DMT)-like permease